MMYGSFCDGWQAYAAAKFGEACLRALQGETGIIECAYVASEVGKHPCPIFCEFSHILWADLLVFFKNVV